MCALGVLVAKFAADMVLPRVSEMDKTGEFDHEITRGLFDNGVCDEALSSTLTRLMTDTSLRSCVTC
jgi:hypothetical protein